ncbi:MAG: T9SS type A sorting domain-containing protein [Sphingobacteriaceae bacterium]|nr:MAG: T9SS type A sorting domain-containing protein [Sphingobacteriaceae bacterium]
MVAGSSINNYGTFRLRNGAEVTMSYNFAAIRNYSTGDFYVNAATVNFNDQCYIDNAGTFTASNNSFLKSNTSGRDLKINNTGTFYAGTTLSPCIITLGGNANAESIINKSGAFFYIASTSVVAPTGVNAIISNAGTFTIRSDVNGSGTIATLGSAGAITGTYNVERYIQGGASKYRGYRLLSSQVNQGTISSIRLYNFDYIKSGTIVSGTTGAAGGFDSSPLNNPTIFLYREDVVPVPNSFTSGNFKGVNKINSTPDSYVIQVDGYGTNNYALPVGNGFMFFFRGDRTTSVFNKTTQPFADPESIVMTTTGTINQGKVTVRNWTTTGTEYLLYTSATANSAVRGFNLVGNPYPSSIDWNKMNTTTSTTGIYAPNVSTKIWIFNGTVKTYGTFVKGDPTGTNGASNIIPSGQGFYVRATSTAAQVIFNEDAKVNTQVTGSNLLMSLPTETETVNRYFRVNFEKDSVNKEDALVFFNKASKTEFSEEEDGEYRKGLNMVGLSTMGADNVPMAVNHTAFTKQRQVLSLNTYINTSLATSGRYTLKLSDITNMPKQYDVWLKDAYKKDSLDIKNNPNYVFDIVKTDSATFSKRFTLVIRQNLGLTYRLLTFTGVKATEGARLNWRTQNEYNYTFFTLERSTDGGTSFKAIANVKANSQGTYSFVDKNPGKGQVKYRLKQEDFNGDITYSSTVPLMYADVAQNVAATNELSVYPNPAVEKIAVKINQPNTDASSYTVNMFNTTGSIVQTYTTGNTESEGNISALHPGTYFIQVLDSKNKSIVGKSKFVKL